MQALKETVEVEKSKSSMDNSDVHMVYVLLDGVGDLPHPDLDGKTPLEAANTPTLDKIAKNGTIGEVISVGNMQEEE
jgi:2,3-bisphosphoglycerate-independent phosphoglycerate mutase